MSTGPTAQFQRSSAGSIFWAILLILFGLLAICLPLATSLGVVLIIGWLLIFSGVAQVVHAFQSQRIGNIIWKVLVALLYLAVGIYFLTHPLMGVATLTFAIGFFFLAESVMDFVVYFKVRKVGGSGWILFDGIITLLLGLMIWQHWPSSSLWGIGTLVGISMLMTGMTRLMLTLAARKIQAAHAG